MHSNNTINSNNLTSSIKDFSTKFKIRETFSQCGARKLRGIPIMTVFYYLFNLVFRSTTLNRDQEDSEKTILIQKVKKDTCHRFLQSLWTDWNKILATISKKMMDLLQEIRPKDCDGNFMDLMYVLDDSSFYRDRSNYVELLGKNFDHALHRMYKGFRMLTLGVTDSKTFTPVAFCNLTNVKASSRINQAKTFDKKYENSFGNIIRKMAQTQTTSVLLKLLEVGIQAGIKAKYVLCDRWFSSPKTIMSILDKKLHVITMLKNNKTRYLFRNEKHTLHQIFNILVKEDRLRRKVNRLSGRQEQKEKGYLYSTEAEIISEGITQKVKLVFVTNKNKKSAYLTLLSTDTTLSEKAIIERFGCRWEIEVFFKALKSVLKLQKTTQSLDYSEIHASTAIAMMQFMMLSYEKRMNSDEASYGALFLIIIDEFSDAAFMEKFTILLTKFCENLEEKCLLPKEILTNELKKFIEDLPIMMREYLESAA